jgi:hypothetical protein
LDNFPLFFVPTCLPPVPPAGDELGSGAEAVGVTLALLVGVGVPPPDPDVGDPVESAGVGWVVGVCVVVCVGVADGAGLPVVEPCARQSGGVDDVESPLAE